MSEEETRTQDEAEVKEYDETNKAKRITPAGAHATIIPGTTPVVVNGAQANDAKLCGILICQALSGTLTISGFKDANGDAADIVFAAGTARQFVDFHEAINEAGALTVTLSNSGDDNEVVIIWIANDPD